MNRTTLHPKFFALIGCFAFSIWFASSCVPLRAAEVTGQVLLPKGAGADEAVVYLIGDVKPAPAAKAVVDQRNETFVPHVSVIPRGTTVQFPNDDTVLHNVFAFYNAKRFDLGVYPRGVSKKETFDKPGVVALLCNVHSEMSAYICVVDTPFYTVTDHTGHFKIAGVPPGTYILHAWHESGAEFARPCAVAAANSAQTVTLVRK